MTAKLFRTAASVPEAGNAAEYAISVSIITPCYNGGPFVADTLRSAIDQSFAPVEIIVIDDGSTDDSAAIAEAFGEPVRVIRQSNAGESVARNRGVEESRGTHLLFLDADDLLAPRALEVLAEALRCRPRAVAQMGCAWFDEDPGSPQFIKKALHTHFFPEVIDGNLGPPHAWLTPRRIVDAAGGFCPELRWFEDWDVWWRVGLVAEEIVPLDYVGALYRQHAQSQLATTKMVDRTRGHAAIMSRMATTLLDRPDIIRESGARLFWSSWTALSRATHYGAPWNELEVLAEALSQLARTGPDDVRATTTARLIRHVGIRGALGVHALRRRVTRQAL